MRTFFKQTNRAFFLSFIFTRGTERKSRNVREIIRGMILVIAFISLALRVQAESLDSTRETAKETTVTSRVVEKRSLLHSPRSAIAPTNAAVVVVPPELPVQIVICHEDADIDALLEEFQITPKFRYQAINGFAAPMDAATAERLRADSRFLSVEADGAVELLNQTIPAGVIRMGVTNSPVAKIDGIPESIDVDVAVIDTGIAPHEDLNVVHFYSPITTDPNDIDGHGTAMAGIIGAIDNGFGVVGVAPGARLWNLKGVGGGATWSDSLQCMDYVWQHADQISVANMSFGTARGTYAPLVSIQSMVRKLVSAGVVVVAGAGNNTNDIAGPDGIFYKTYSIGFPPVVGVDDFLPAGLRESMAVSAMNPEADVFSVYSNFNEAPRSPNYVISPGAAIDVAAPGDNILTTGTNNDYRLSGGTSSATAHVSGLVALYIAANGRAYNEPGVYKIRQAIVNASLPQSQWNTTNTLDLDSNPEPLAIASTNWLVPVVTTSPADLNVDIGETAIFMAEITGLRPLTHYQWFLNGTNVTNGERISGANSNVLSISDAQIGDAGAYHLVITNIYGAATSSVANLTVGPCSGLSAPNGLAAWWRFQNDSKDWVGGHDGISQKGEVYGAATVGNGLLLDARSGPIVISNSPPLNPTNGLSVEAWFKPELYGESKGQALVRKYYLTQAGLRDQFALLVTGPAGSSDVTEPPYSFTFSANYFVQPGNPERVYTPANTWTPGNWYHIVGTYDKQHVKLYVNGALVSTSAHPAGNILTGDQPIWIGGTSTATTPGTIDEVSLYNRALTASEISALYNAGSAGKCASGTPNIATQPVGLTVTEGDFASLAVTAYGRSPITYQWWKGGSMLSGETNAMLSFGPFSQTNAGEYYAVVSNPSGVVTSVVANVSFAPPFPTNIVIVDGLLAYYRFNKDALDYSGNARHGVLIGNPTNTTDRFGVLNGAYNFHGNTVSASNLDPDNYPTNFSFGGWFKQNAPNGMLASWVPEASWGGTFLQVPVNAFQIRFGSGNPASNHDVSVFPLPLGEWHHVFATHDSTADRLYLNGMKVGEWQAYSLQSNGPTLTIGDGFHGSVDEFMVFSRALTETEVQELRLHGIEALAPTVPIILAQPSNRVVTPGTTVNFSANVSGEPPLFFQWRKAGEDLVDGANISGATTGSLTVTDAQFTNAGSYDLVVSNSFGSVTSQLATLKVYLPAAIVSQPESRTNAAGTTANFNVAATGTEPLIYQWRKAGVNLTNHTNPTLTLTNVEFMDAGNYDVVVSNPYSSVTSSVAVLTVVSGPLIVGQPTSLTNTAGTTAMFTVSATGTQPLAYQWRKDGGNLIGKTEPTLTLSNVQLSDEGNYDVVLTNDYGSVTSVVAVLTVVVTPAIIAQPQSRTNFPGTLATFSVTATGAEPLSYRWRKSGVSLNDTGNVSGALTNVLQINDVATADAGAYDIVVSNHYGSVTSVVATLTVVTNTLTWDLLLWLPFDGNALDASGNERNGVVQGATSTTNRMGQSDMAFRFDGTSLVTVGNLDPDHYAGGFSFGCWIRPVNGGGSPAYWIHDAGWGSTFMILSAPNSVHLRLGSGFSSTDYGVGGLNLSLGQWHHLFVTHDTNYNRFFVNGIKRFEASSLPLQGNVATLELGKDGYAGDIDDLVVFQRGLTTNEVMELYTSGIPGLGQPPTITVESYVLNWPHLTLTFSGTPGSSWNLERASFISGPWTNIGSLLIGANGVIQFEDTNSPTGSGFYRAKQP